MARFERTRQALEVWDKSIPEIRKLLDGVTTDEQVQQALAREKEADDLVREAFWHDTQDVNSKEQAYLVHPADPWLRRVVTNG